MTVDLISVMHDLCNKFLKKLIVFNYNVFLEIDFFRNLVKYVDKNYFDKSSIDNFFSYEFFNIYCSLFVRKFFFKTLLAFNEEGYYAYYSYSAKFTGNIVFFLLRVDNTFNLVLSLIDYIY